MIFISNESFLLDSLIQDSLYRARKDSLRRDSLMKAAPRAAINVSARKRVFVPLPDGMTLTVTDSALVNSNHYLAIEKYFKTTFKQLQKKSIMSVQIGPRNYRTEVYVRSLPLLQAEFLEQKEQRFISESEIDAYQKRQKEYFSKTIEVVVDVRSLYIASTELSEEMFSIKLSSNEIIVEPLEIQLQPLYSMITEFVPWYQRRVTLKFPRKVNNVDIWENRTLVLLINLKDLRTFTDPTYQVDFRFDLNPENKIDPEKVLLERN
ncbi:hypothetical protein EP331_06740 [bacterium]|nr:MAG: hypothetical protein EP331_06740 [bacterium]